MCCSLIMGVLSAVAYAISLITFAQWQSQNCSIFDHATREIVIGIDEMSEKRSELAVRADIEEILCKQQVYFNIFLAFGLLISVLLIAGACTKRSSLLLPWLFVSFLQLIAAAVIVFCVITLVDKDVVPGIFTVLAIKTLIWICVYHEYSRMEKNAELRNTQQVISMISPMDIPYYKF